jgi:hypothetical protein
VATFDGKKWAFGHSVGVHSLILGSIPWSFW